MNWKSVRRFSLVALASLGLAACGINSVPAAEENAKAKWADVQAAFQERANLIPNLEQIVLSSAEQERETFNQVIEARASITWLNVSRSCSAEDRTICSRLGIRFARSWNAAWTSAHLALAFSSAAGTELIPQAARPSEARATSEKRRTDFQFIE